MKALASAAVAAAVLTGACARSAPPRAPSPPPPVTSRSAATPAEPQPRDSFRCGPTDREYEAWFDSVFGHGYEVFHDGPDPARLQALTGATKTRAEQMLRRGIQACSLFSVHAVKGAGWRILIPDLTRAVTANDADFRAQAPKPSLLEAFGFDPPPSAEEKTRLAKAADLLDAAITERLAAGPCAKTVALETMVNLYFVRVSARVVALTVEDRVGPCERNLAFVAFLDSPDGFGRWLSPRARRASPSAISRSPISRSSGGDAPHPGAAI